MKTKIEKYIFALRQCAEEHKYDRTFTGQINVYHLCNDTADLLESLEHNLNRGSDENSV